MVTTVGVQQTTVLWGAPAKNTCTTLLSGTHKKDHTEAASHRSATLATNAPLKEMVDAGPGFWGQAPINPDCQNRRLT